MLKEDFLHYLWKYKLFDTRNLVSVLNQKVQILNFGTQNHNSGPDFFNARIVIDDQTWVGNVEIHVKASDWYLHRHENNQNYDNVILHVVWQNDIPILRNNGETIPAIELKNVTSPEILNNYNKLIQKKSSFIPCEKDIHHVDKFVLNNWLEVLYIERLNNKTKFIEELLHQTQNNWEEVFFKLLAKNFGLKVNGEAFLNLANSFDYTVFRKQLNNLENTEALLFGQAGFLSENINNPYHKRLKSEYQYLQSKFNLEPCYNGQFLFSRLRPYNFPTVRIAQLSNLFFNNKKLFAAILEAKDAQGIYKLFDTNTSEYWYNHYNFKSDSKTKISNKRLSKYFVNLLIINSIIPMIFTFEKKSGKSNLEKTLSLIKEIQPEDNQIIRKFRDIQINPINAFESQAILQLKTAYCNKYRCLKCTIGYNLLKEKI